MAPKTTTKLIKVKEIRTTIELEKPGPNGVRFIEIIEKKQVGHKEVSMFFCTHNSMIGNQKNNIIVAWAENLTKFKARAEIDDFLGGHVPW